MSSILAKPGPPAATQPAAAGARPVIFVASSDGSVLRALEADLRRRFGNDTRIVAADGSENGLAALEALAAAQERVALVIADQQMAGTTGIEFLASAHRLHPAAKRILLVERDYTTANPIVPAMMLGQIDYHLVKPWFPDHGLYPAVSEFLASLGELPARGVHDVPDRGAREQPPRRTRSATS